MALTGRAALVTGGARGIGRGIVERLARDGADVVFSYVSSAAAADEVVTAAAGLAGRVVAVAADISAPAEVSALFDAAERELGGVDILVNNAGLALTVSFADASGSDYDRVMNVNARGTFLMLHEAATRLRDQGRIVNISSINTLLPAPGGALYCASKAAIEQFTRVAALELAGRGITVNSVSPGWVDTDLLRANAPPEALAELASLAPLGRLTTAEDVAATVAFLVGDDGGWMTGQNLRPSGGVV